MLASPHLNRLIACMVLGLVGLSLAGCLHPGAKVAPNVRPRGDVADIGKGLNNYSQATMPSDGLIAVEGDGLAYGSQADGPRPGINGSSVKRNTAPFPEFLARVLHVHVENRGFPADTISQGEARWAGKPSGSILVIAYGYGDAQVKTPAARYAETLNRMIAAAQSKGAAVVLVVAPKTGNADFDALVEPYREAMRQAAKTFRVLLLDTPALIPPSPAPGFTLFGPKNAAGSHRYGEDYQVIANTLAQYILIAPTAP